jgi:uncharacterized protein YpbB
MQEFGKEILGMVISYRRQKGMDLPLNAEKEVEKEGMDSKQISYELFIDGKSINEIASDRRMAITTIEGHLAHYVGIGALELDRLVERQKSKVILQYIEKHQSQQMTEIHASLGNDYSYSEIRFVIKHLEAKRQLT